MTENVLSLIEEYASLYLTVNEISVLLDLDAEELKREIRCGKSDVAKAYREGKMQTELELRRNTKAFAAKGSPQAEAQMREYAVKQKLAE